MQTIFKDVEEKMKKVLEHLRKEFMGVRSGRASTGLLDNVKVDYYGSVMPINQLAAVSIPEARTLEIKPWDKAALTEIEKAIQKSEIGITPVNDGKLLRITLPEPTTERRQELVKLVKKLSEEDRVSIRNIRREGIEKLKDQEKNKALSQDDSKNGQTHIQKLTDDYMKKIDEILANKEKEIMQI